MKNNKEQEQNDSDLARYTSDPVAFIQDYLIDDRPGEPFKLLPFQQRLIDAMEAGDKISLFNRAINRQCITVKPFDPDKFPARM